MSMTQEQLRGHGSSPSNVSDEPRLTATDWSGSEGSERSSVGLRRRVRFDS
ncbi:hypothetical protein NSMM_190017 [Nitrosomonas mobilis]|uniref:Uncharacterized protein n=1 Tax=Nitrosomonas mobilis TaxID=51642 RepID=A0A1G5SCF3_9PROT|nr:hypothetical protein NSMM_190017 [Nitrosomonas mobilis]